MIRDSTEESGMVLARLCSEDFNNDAIAYYLEASPTARDFRNRFAAVFFRACQRAFQNAQKGNTLKDETVKLADNFDAARERLEDLGDEFAAWLNVTQRWGGVVHGFAWETQKHRATLAAMAVLDTFLDFMRAHAELRFDLYAKTQTTAQL